MKLVAFSVKNYRSIQSTPRIALSELTVLVGPNNEGKSNLLSALVCALTLAQERNPTARRALLGNQAYQFDRDFPVSLQTGVAKASSTFDLEFELDANDQLAFKATVGSKLNGTLPIQISVGKDGGTTYAVKKQGRSQKTLNTKRVEIGRFIAERLQFQYIGAVRDEEQSRAIVESMVARALATLEGDASYQQALKSIEDAERPVLDAVSAKVMESLKPFVGSLKSVSTQVTREQRTRAMRRSAEIWLDDGTLTPLSQKGDGVKSLVAIALAKASAEGSAGDRNLILAIEEPEAHLHSGAIHILKALLEDIARTRQVIISTHEPALVRRDSVGSNILVQGNMAKPADSLEEVRRVLGVQLAENLVSPDLVALVEGPGDARLLTARIKVAEPKLYKAIASGRLRLQPLHGAGNLPHQLRFYQALVCSAVAFVDHDLDGNAALTRARKDGLLDTGAEFCASKPGHIESELEDLLDPALYESELCALLGVSSLKPKAAKSAKAKWSVRLETVLAENGKPKADHERLIREAKFKVCELAVANAASCFIPALTGPIDALVKSLKSKLAIADGPAGAALT
jgi:putative ATP-dependent endonuclease of the OLD family